MNQKPQPVAQIPKSEDAHCLGELNERIYLKVNEIIRFYGINKSTLYRAVNRGLITRYYFDKLALFKKSELDKVISES